MIPKWRLAVLLSYFSVASVSAAIITPGLPAMQLYFGLKAGVIDWVMTAFLAGYVVGQLIYAPLANRFGRLYALRSGLIINLLGILICMLACSLKYFDLLIAGRFICAFGAASGLACTFMLVNEWLPQSLRKTAMAYSILSFTLGIGIAVTLGGLVTEYLTWPICFIVLFVQGILLFWGTWLFEETLSEVKSINFYRIFADYKNALQSSTLVIFALAAGFCSAIGYCFSTAAPQIARQVLHLSPSAYGYWNLLNMLGMLVGALWAKRLGIYYTARQVLLWGMAGCALGIGSLLAMICGHQSSAGWFFCSTASLYLFSGLVFANASLIATSALQDKACASAMMSFINMLTAAMCVLLMGYLSVNTLQGLTEILLLMWLLVYGLLLQYPKYQQALN